MELGLVDQLGNLDAAIEAAAARAELASYAVEYVEQPATFSELFFQQLAERTGGLGLLPRSDRVAALLSLAQPLLDTADLLTSLQDPRHMYLRCVACSEAF